MPYKIIFTTIVLIAIVSAIALPILTNAAQNEEECKKECKNKGEEYENFNKETKVCSCKSQTGNGGTVTIGPPYGDSGPKNVPDVIKNVTNWVLGISGALSALLIIISGMRYVTASGNTNLQEAAKKSLINAIIGVVIIVTAFVIVQIVMRVLTGRE